MKANLIISTWAGSVACASHYSGRLRIGREESYLEHTLTPAEARQMNIEDRRQGRSDFAWKAGHTSTRFLSEAAVIERAIEVIRADHPQVTVLLKGESSTLDPQPILIGPEPLMSEGNGLVAEAEANNWWEGDERVMDNIYKRWRKLLEAVV